MDVSDPTHPKMRHALAEWPNLANCAIGMIKTQASTCWPPPRESKQSARATACSPKYKRLDVNKKTFPKGDEARRSESASAVGNPPTKYSATFGRLFDRDVDWMLDEEILEMLLSFAKRNNNNKRLATYLIKKFGSFANVLSAPPDELLKIVGMPPAGVAAIKIIRGSAIRLAQPELGSDAVLSNWDGCVAYLQLAMGRHPVEQFRILFLDARNRLVADELHSQGTIDQVSVSPREIAKRALKLNAVNVILVHNHPSGDPTPSTTDLDMTIKVENALKLIGINLHDHIIVGNGSSFSLRKQGFI